MKTLQKLTVFGLLLLMSACNGIREKLFTGSITEHIYDTRAYVVAAENCIFGKQPESGFIPLILSIAPALIEKGIEYSGELLKKESEKYERVYSARSVGNFYRVTFVSGETGTESRVGITPENNCIGIVRGKFGEITDAKSGSDEFWERQMLENLGLAEPPDFFLESKMVYSPREGVFRLVPIFLEFKSAYAERGRDKKDLLITYAFEVPANSVIGTQAKTLATANLAFNNVKAGSRIKKIRNMTTEWIQLPAVSAEFLGELEQRDDDPAIRPFSVLISIKESSEGGDLLLKASEAIKGGGKDITDKILEFFNLKKEEGKK